MSELDATPDDAASTHELRRLEDALGYRFRSEELLEQALVHASALDEGGLRCAERLEFLGDAVLDLVVSEQLLQVYPTADEGTLSRYRAGLVNTESFAEMAAKLELGAYLRLGKGEARSGGRQKPTILTDAYEALIGAVFLDGGYEEARRVIRHHFDDVIASVASRASRDAKTELQELLHKRVGDAPSYRVVEESGPAHAREFVVEAVLGDTVLARGHGRSKRAAEQAAARSALANDLAE